MELSGQESYRTMHVLWEKYQTNKEGWKDLVEVMEKISGGKIIDQVCPSRLAQRGPGESDYWFKVSNGHQCSYCGSMHPDDFIKHCNKVIGGEVGFGLEKATNKDKIYLSTPGVSNAHDGCIKFYGYHIPVSSVDPNKRDGEFLNVVNSALSPKN